MTRPSPQNLLGVLALLASIAAAAWLANQTEWVDAWQRLPPRGEALHDPHYALKQLATRLGAKVASPDNLQRLPPAGATLVLQSSQWDFVPGRDEQLQAWVEAGGHLVLPAYFSTGNEIDWVPIREKQEPKTPAARAQPRPVPNAVPNAAPPPARRPLGPRFVGPDDRGRPCPALHEARDDAGPALGAESGGRFRVCNADVVAPIEAVPPARSTWAVANERGAQILRVSLGRGQVTAIAPYGLLNNGSLFLGNHAQLAVAALDLRPGAEVWFVIDERRDALLLWLWRRGGPAIVLAALALALALWRGAVRFGPLLPQAPAGRRSVAEQVRGTAAFVLRGGGAPLLAAARRALDEAARRRIVDYDAKALADRAAALAAPTGLPADALTLALDPRRPPPRGRAMADRLALLESARRRLVRNPSTSA